MHSSQIERSRKEKIQLAYALKERARRKSKEKTVIGFVDTEGRHTHSIVVKGGKWTRTKKKPVVYLAEKLESVVRSNKRFIAIIGGRGSSKSVGIADIDIVDAKDNGSKTYCLREFQSSIKNSVHSLLKDEISRLEFEGFDVQQQTIRRDDEDVFQFAGIARNASSIKSAHGFRRFFVEEAQFLSQESLDALTPTARNKPNKGLPMSAEEIKEQEDSLSGVQIIFVGNPQSSEDPFSQRFIVPFQEDLDRDGFYEDDLHLIVVMNYHDNPWFLESGLEAERKWAELNLSSEMYNHVWLGGYNDSVENSLIQGSWFDACVDADKKLGWEARGAKIASHDPSDQGGDTKGYAMRHGSVVQDVQEKADGDVNEGGHWACDIARKQGVDYFTFDGDGLGAGLNEQISKDLSEKSIRIAMFKGSESPDHPDTIYKPAMSAPISDQKKVKDVFNNKRAQYYSELRDRVYRTYRWVVHGEYADPDLCISFNGDMPLLKKLRAELCRMPVKPRSDGLVDLYTKEIMKSKFGIPSPNLGDSVMMIMRYVSVDVTKPYIPKPIGSMPLRRR